MEDRIFVNTPMETDLLEKLDEMARKNEQTRAQLIRLLIRQRWEVENQNEPDKNKSKRKPVAA